MERKKTNVFCVVSVILMIVMVVSAVNGNIAGKKTADAKTGKKVVILYFSATGTTKGAANRIKNATGGELIGIKAAQPYTEKDLDYSNDDSRVTKEHETADSPAESDVRPKISNLKAIQKAVNKADVVYIGASDIIRTS